MRNMASGNELRCAAEDGQGTLPTLGASFLKWIALRADTHSTHRRESTTDTPCRMATRRWRQLPHPRQPGQPLPLHRRMQISHEQDVSIFVRKGDRTLGRALNTSDVRII